MINYRISKIQTKFKSSYNIVWKIVKKIKNHSKVYEIYNFINKAFKLHNI